MAVGLLRPAEPPFEKEACEERLNSKSRAVGFYSSVAYLMYRTGTTGGGGS
jgi:hypothetical protein